MRAATPPSLIAWPPHLLANWYSYPIPSRRSHQFQSAALCRLDASYPPPSHHPYLFPGSPHVSAPKESVASALWQRPHVWRVDARIPIRGPSKGSSAT